MTKQPEPVSTRVLMEQCWDELEPDPNRVQVLIGQLRRKLHDPPIIETVLRRGYRLIPPRP
ncbi:winged helix-turn-helix domain-containing protein [Fodinicola feengrottensis]|nr:helix-turn-helix domain-containing protein [Fodinicola feengrottensis]